MNVRMPSLGSFTQSKRLYVKEAASRSRKPGTVALLSLSFLALGIFCVAFSGSLQRFARSTGGTAAGWLGCTQQKVYAALRPPARPQAGAACAPSFTSINAAGAGTATLQGTTVTSINAGGDVAGIYITAPNIAHGYLWSAASGNITEFDAPSTGSSLNEGTFATAIDTADDIAGMYADSNVAIHGFVRSGASGTITEFDVPGAPTTVKHRGTSPLGMNASGVITGLYTDVNAVRHGFVRAVDGTITPFDVPLAGTALTEGTVPFAINAAGDIAGLYIDSNHVFHGFLRTASNGAITAPIDAPGAGTTGVLKGFTFGGTIAIGVDDADDVAGIYADANHVFHGYVRAASGTYTTFDVTGVGDAGLFPGTLPTSMNPGGDVTGFYTDANGVNHGFLRTANGTITAPFDAPGAATSGMFSGTASMAINGNDEMAGAYADSSGVFHGFVLTATGATAAPTFSPAPATYATPQSVTISDATSGATIYYTTDGTTPTTSSTQYTGPISVNATETIMAIAVANGCSTSPVASGLFTIAPPAATPTFSPAGGTYTSAQSVTLADTTPGATIYYTTDNSTPTTASTQYSSAISVSSTETIKAIAAATGFSTSMVASATYTINLPTPDFTVAVNPTSLTIAAGQSGMASFTVTPVNGFNSQVTFACTGLPAGAACNFNPPSVAPSGPGAVKSVLTVTTTANSARLWKPLGRSRQPVFAALLPVLALIFGFVARREVGRRTVRLLTLLLLLAVTATLTSCNNGGSSGNSGTPPGTDSVSVSAATSGAAAINHAATLTITITQ